MTVKTYVGRLILSAVTVLVGIAALLIAHGFPEAGGPGTIGPAYFPELLGYVLVLLGAVEGLIALMRRPAGAVHIPGMASLFAFGCVTAAFIYLAPLLGWYLATFLYAFTSLLLLNARQFVLAGLTAGITTAVVYAVFGLVLHIAFPVGRLF